MATSAQTKLLCHFNGVDAGTTYISDDENARTVTFAGTAQLDTAIKKFGSASLMLDGNSDYVTVPNSADFNFGTGNFTIDFWFYALDVTNPAITQSIFSHGDFFAAGGYKFYVNSASFDFLFPVAPYEVYSLYTFSNTTWYHVAIVRNGNDMTVYINGVPIKTTTANPNFSCSTTFNIGVMDDLAGQFFNGYVEEFRITNTAEWTADFSDNLPTSEYSFSTSQTITPAVIKTRITTQSITLRANAKVSVNTLSAKVVPKAPTAVLRKDATVSVPMQVDQQNNIGTSTIVVGDLNNVEYRQAQSFILSGSGNQLVGRVSVYYFSKYSFPTGNITIRIETDNEDLPSGILANANASISFDPDDYDSGWIDLDFSTFFNLTAGTSYWIIWQCENQSLSRYWKFYASQSSDPYPNGCRANSNDGGVTWTADTDSDMRFKVWVYYPIFTKITPKSPTISIIVKQAITPAAILTKIVSLSPTIRTNIAISANAISTQLKPQSITERINCTKSINTSSTKITTISPVVRTNAIIALSTISNRLVANSCTIRLNNNISLNTISIGIKAQPITISADASISVNTISLSAKIQSSNIKIDNTISANALSNRISSFAPTITITMVENVTITPAVISNRISSYSPLIRIDTTTLLGMISTRIRIQTPSVKITAVILIGTLSNRVNPKTPLIRINITAALDTAQNRITLLSPVIRRNIVIGADTLSSVISQLSPEVRTSIITALSLLQARLSLYSPLIRTPVVTELGDVIRLLSRIEQIIMRQSRMSQTITEQSQIEQIITLLSEIDDTEIKKSRIDKVIKLDSPLH